MRKEEIQAAIAEELIIRKIYSIRGKQVMLSQDLAELYEVGTRVLNQQVKRNIGKFLKGICSSLPGRNIFV